jgi:hypothetical protein
MTLRLPPTFLVIGAYKSGTTSVHHYLAQHPQVFVPRRKEPNYFAFGDVSVAVGTGAPARPATPHPAAATSVTRREDYVRLFDGVAGEPAVGEVSPEYLVNERACDAIRRELPDARLVAVLRDPVQRAWSDYLMYRRDGLEPAEDFGRALDEQEERRRQGAPTAWYVESGLYGRQLARYYDAFPAEQISVHLFDDLVRDPDGTMAAVTTFLGVDPVPLRTVDQLNASGVPRNRALAAVLRSRRWLGPALKAVLPDRLRPGLERVVQRGLDRPAIAPEHRARLIETYQDDVALLGRLTGRDLSSWLTPG